MARKELKIKVNKVEPGDSYADGYTESVTAIKNRLAENIISLKKATALVVWDIHQLYLRWDEWRDSTESMNLFTELELLTGYSAKYLRDMVRIGDMLIRKNRMDLLDSVAIGKLRALSYKEDEAIDILMDKLEIEDMKEEDIRGYQLTDISPKTGNTRNFTLSSAVLKNHSHGINKFGDQTIFWVRLSEKQPLEDLVEIEKQLKEVQNEIKQIKKSVTQN